MKGTKRNSPKKFSKKAQQILQAGEDLFTRFGIKRVTVEEICRKAGASKMTFYQYFKNKNDLALEILKKWTDEHISWVHEVSASDLPISEKLDLILERKRDLMSQMAPEFVLELTGLEYDHDVFYRHILSFLLDAQGKGEIRPGIRPEFFIAAIDKLLELAHDEKLRSVYPDLDSFTREIFNFFYYGLLPRPDRKGRG